MFDEYDSDVSDLSEDVSGKLFEIPNSYAGTVPLFNKGAIYSHLDTPDEFYMSIMGDILDIPLIRYCIPIPNTMKENQLKISSFLENLKKLETVTETKTENISLLKQYPVTEDESEEDVNTSSTHFFDLLISPYDRGRNTQDIPGDDVVVIGSYTRAERRRKIQRYREKRKRRHLKKKILYTCRQKFARERPRVGGRFVKKGYVPPTPA